MNQVRQSYYIRESAVSTQPQGNSFNNSRNNSGVIIHHQGSIGNGAQMSSIANNSIQTTALAQGCNSSSINNQSRHQKQQSYVSNHSIPKNQYVINVTQDSSLMTVADANNQRKSLSILTTQQSQLKELFRNKAQTPKNYHTNSISQQQINVPYLKDNYLIRNNDNANQSGYFSRSNINKNKFIELGDSDQKRRQSSTLFGYSNLNGNASSEQKQQSNFYHKQAKTHSHIKVVDNKEFNDTNKKLPQQSQGETISKEQQSNIMQLQQSYIQKLKNNKLVKQKDYKYQIFTNIIQNFLLNEALIDHTDVSIKQQLKDLELELQEQKDQEQKMKTDSSQSKSSHNYIESEKDNKKANDQNFLNVLHGEANTQQHSPQNQSRRPSVLQIMQQKYSHTTSELNSQEDAKPKVQFITEFNSDSTNVQRQSIKGDNKLVINIINSQNEMAIHDFVSNSKQEINLQKNFQSGKSEEATDPKANKQKEDLLMLLMDFLNNIEHQFLEGVNCKFYPQEDFIKLLMKDLMELSNKICHFLMQRKEKVACIFINSILKIFTQILEKQYVYVKDQVKQLVKIQVSEHNEKFNYYVNKKKELEDKISEMHKEQDRIILDFQKKIVAMEEIKNQYLEQAEILREQIEESKTKKYKDYQLERIQVQSKEVIKNCAQIEAEIIKRREDTKESIQGLAKMTMEHFSTVKSDPRRRSVLGNLGLSGINQSDLILQGSMHSDNQQSFSEFNMITYAAKYDKPESKAAILFSHPFQFYIQQDIHNYMYDKLIPKQSRPDMIKLLENYMEEVKFLNKYLISLMLIYYLKNLLKNIINFVLLKYQFQIQKVTIQKYGGNKINGPLNFLSYIFQQVKNNFMFFQIKFSWMLQKYQNFFVVSIKITEIAFLLQSLVNSKKEIGIYFATIFGIVQDNMLSDSQFEFMISIRKMLKLYIPYLDILDTLKEPEINKMIDDQIFIPAKQALESFQTVFKNHPQYTKIEEKFQIYLKTKKVQINQRAINEQRKIVNSKFGESSLTLIPNLMEKMKTENINDVIRSLENIFIKLDQKQQEKGNTKFKIQERLSSKIQIWLYPWICIEFNWVVKCNPDLYFIIDYEKQIQQQLQKSKSYPSKFFYKHNSLTKQHIFIVLSQLWKQNTISRQFFLDNPQSYLLIALQIQNPDYQDFFKLIKYMFQSNQIIQSLFFLIKSFLFKVNYNSFKKLMYNHYGVDTENESISEYFSEFIFGEWFNYQGFIQKVIKLHIPDDVNDKLVCYYSTMNEICSLLMHNQNQSFHEFKNRLSNYLFNMESLNFFQFNTIDQFFKSYENSKDDQLKFNTKRISPALLYQQLFKQNEFGQLYQYFKSSGNVGDENCEFIKRLYPQRFLLDNFNEFLDYNRHIYQFLQIQEKISIVQAPPPSETSIQYFNPPVKSSSNLKRLNTMSKIKAAKLSKFTSQSSNVSNKSSSNQPYPQASRKSQFNLQQLTKSNTIVQQDTIQFDRSDSKESAVSIATPGSASKKSIFSGI